LKHSFRIYIKPLSSIHLSFRGTQRYKQFIWYPFSIGPKELTFRNPNLVLSRREAQCEVQRIQRTRSASEAIVSLQ